MLFTSLCKPLYNLPLQLIGLGHPTSFRLILSCCLWLCCCHYLLLLSKYFVIRYQSPLPKLATIIAMPTYSPIFDTISNSSNTFTIITLLKWVVVLLFFYQRAGLSQPPVITMRRRWIRWLINLFAKLTYIPIKTPFKISFVSGLILLGVFLFLFFRELRFPILFTFFLLLYYDISCPIYQYNFENLWIKYTKFFYYNY